jgi:hypothetical protein
MADRYDRDYERERSRWRDEEAGGNRDWESEGGWARGRTEFGGEFGGSTRRGWGRSQEYEPERWSGRSQGYYGTGSQQGQRGGRWYGSQQDEFGQGRGYRGEPGQMHGQNYGQGTRLGRGQGYQQRGGRMGQQYGTGFGREQGWQGQGYGQGYGRSNQPGYGPGMQGQGYGQMGQGWQGQDYLTDRMEDDFDTDFDDTPITVTYTEFWLVPGPFSGIGPDDYTRSPERLREDIIQRLTQHGQIDAANIAVEVNDNCEVTLTGQVNSRPAKRLAEDVAESVWGVNDVHNQLKVRSRETRPLAGQGSQGNAQSVEKERTTSTRGQTGSRSKA